MKQITSDEFKALIKENAAWASKIKESYEITDYCDMYKSTITHLSPLLTFSGDNGTGRCANFYGCKNLKIATGNYLLSVVFSKSGISEIKDLFVGKCENGVSVYFHNCLNLKVLSGDFKGIVYAKNSPIETFKNFNAPILDSDPKITKKFYSFKKLNELKEIISDKTKISLVVSLPPTVKKEIELRQRLQEKAAGIQLHGF